MVHKSELDQVKFKKNSNGLYIIDLSGRKDREYLLVNTVQENKQKYMAREVERAKVAKKLYYALGNPSIPDFKNILRSNLIQNCPVNVKDVMNCEMIYGPDVYTLKGKSTRSKPLPIVLDYVEIPRELKAKHEYVKLCADVMYIQGITFLVTVSKRLKFITVERLKTRARLEFAEKLIMYFQYTIKLDS